MENTTGTAFRAPQAYARLGGALYLFIIVTGIFTELFVRDRLIAAGDPETTAYNILGSEYLWRIGIAGGLGMLMSAVVLALILYYLLSPVNKYMALLAVFFNLVSISIEAVIKLNLVLALNFLKSADYLEAFTAGEVYAQAYELLMLHSAGYNISLIFFALNCICWGYLLFKSGYFPRFLGILLWICGGCYLVNSFAWLINPSFANILFPLILVPCLIAELALCLWLLVRGVNLRVFNEMVVAGQIPRASFKD